MYSNANMTPYLILPIPVIPRIILSQTHIHHSSEQRRQHPTAIYMYPLPQYLLIEINREPNVTCKSWLQAMLNLMLQRAAHVMIHPSSSIFQFVHPFILCHTRTPTSNTHTFIILTLSSSSYFHHPHIFLLTRDSILTHRTRPTT